MTPKDRLKKNLRNHNGFTAKAKDWKIVKQFKLEAKADAVIQEKKIKKRGIGRWHNDN